MKSFRVFVESLEDDLKNPEKHVHGGRKPKRGELRTLYHSTSVQNAHHILNHGFKTFHQVAGEHTGKEVYGDTGAQHFVHTSMTHKGSYEAAMGNDVTFVLNAEPHAHKAVVMPEYEGGLVSHHGGLPKETIKGIKINHPSAEATHLVNRWNSMKRK